VAPKIRKSSQAGQMPWTPAVVDLRIGLLPDRQDVRAPFLSRRLASRQTVRAEAILPVHP
jgi:hypothetical protein